MERVHFDENGNRRDYIGGKIKKEDYEMDKIRNNCYQCIYDTKDGQCMNEEYKKNAYKVICVWHYCKYKKVRKERK